MSLPIAWVLKDKHVLLVGGGEVAETRVRKLVPNDAIVTVVAPSVTPHIEDLVNDKKVRWVRRNFKMSDLELQHWTFVLTAIDDHETSEEIAKHCRASHIPVNVADVIPLCDFYFGANFEQGPLKVMVSTGSGAPRLAKRVLNELSNHAAKFQFGDAISNVQRIRTCLREQLPGNDPKVSQTRMLLMKTLCDKLTFPELAGLKQSDMAPMIRGMILSTAACPAHPIGDVRNAEDFVDEPLPESPKKNGHKNKNALKKDSKGNSTSHSESNSDSGNGSSGSSSSESNSASDSESNDDSNSDSENDMDSDSGTNDNEKPTASNSPKNRKMKRKATECADGYPQPPVPKFPFRPQ